MKAPHGAALTVKATLAAGVTVNELLEAPVSCAQRFRGASDNAAPHERSSHLHHTGRPRHLRPRNRITDRKTSE